MGGMWLFWILLLVVLFLAIRSFASGSGSREGLTRGSLVDTVSESAEDVLKKRYARGDIDRDEFEVKLRDLRGHDTPHASPSRP